MCCPGCEDYIDEDDCCSCTPDEDDDAGLDDAGLDDAGLDDLYYYGDEECT